jgi:hypothetical protein
MKKLIVAPAAACLLTAAVAVPMTGAHVWSKAKAERAFTRAVVRQNAEYQRRADTTAVHPFSPFGRFLCRRTGPHQFRCPIRFRYTSSFAPDCEERSVYYLRLVGTNVRIRRVVLGTNYEVFASPLPLPPQPGGVWRPGDDLLDCVYPAGPSPLPPGY